MTTNDTPARPLVLIVDDYEEGREICAEYLAFRGYGVLTAEDGVEALAKSREHHPDVILMDLSLPRLDGWETTRRLKADASTADIPVIALTAHALSSARQKALEAGCDEVVTKPCIPKDLEEEVRRQLDKRGGAGRPVGEGAEAG